MATKIEMWKSNSGQVFKDRSDAEVQDTIDEMFNDLKSEHYVKECKASMDSALWHLKKLGWQFIPPERPNPAP